MIFFVLYILTKYGQILQTLHWFIENIEFKFRRLFLPSKILFSLQKVVGILDRNLKPPNREKWFKMHFCVDQQHFLSREFICRHLNEVLFSFDLILW